MDHSCCLGVGVGGVANRLMWVLHSSKLRHLARCQVELKHAAHIFRIIFCGGGGSDKWVASLDRQDRMLLRIWRAGAVRSPTRLGFRPRTKQVEATVGGATQCRWCEHPRASARHFWVECRRFGGTRRELEEAHGVREGWWAAQPRCTAMTGWITFGAAADLGQRAALQVAACRLGCAIVRALAHEHDDAPT